jgi:hypothetical protein
VETPTRFLIGVGGLLTFRGSGFEFKVVAISTRGDIAIIKLESGETIAMLFMPRYRCIGVEGVLSGYELTKFIATTRTYLTPIPFNTINSLTSLRPPPTPSSALQTSLTLFNASKIYTSTCPNPIKTQNNHCSNVL